MKKQLKFASFLITCCLAFTNCQKDDLETPQDPQQSKLVYRKIPFADLSSKSPKTINELEKVLEKSKTNDLRRGLNENNSYTIDSTSIAYIDNGEGYSSYTFSVIPTQNDTHLQNIVISNYYNGETKAFLAEYELNKTIEQVDDNFVSSIKKTEFYNLNNPNMVYGRGSLCVDLGYEAIVNVCEGELVTPGQNPECFNSDGTPATKKVFIIVASACSDSGSGGSGSTGSSPGTGTGTGSSGGGGGTPNPNPSNPIIPNPEPNPNNPSEPVTVIGDVITSPTLPSPTGFKTFFSGLNLQQQEWLNLPENADAKNDMRAFLIQNNYSEDASDTVISVIDSEITDDETEVDEDLAPSCESFNFSSTGANWQEASVKNIKFKIYIYIPPTDLYVGQNIRYSSPILFGMPKNTITYGNISAGTAAELSAQALSITMSETVNMYSNQFVSEMIVRLYFQQRLKHNYQIVTNGGRVNFNSNSTLPATQYQTNAFGTGNCD